MLKEFKNEVVEVKFSVEDLKVKNLKEEGAKFVKVKSKSELFKTLYDLGMEICDIARECESHYSFVYGVISNSRENVRKVKTESKSDIIRKMFDEGKTPGEISKELNSNYSFVFSVVKKYKSTKEVQNEVV